MHPLLMTLLWSRCLIGDEVHLLLNYKQKIVMLIDCLFHIKWMTYSGQWCAVYMIFDTEVIVDQRAAFAPWARRSRKCLTNKPACLNSDSQVDHMLTCSYTGSQGFICFEGANKPEAKPNVRQLLAAHVTVGPLNTPIQS